MLKEYRNDFICDLAETYGIYDYSSLPVSTLTTLLKGLRDDSRIMLKISGRKIPFETELTAAMVDRLSYLVWAKTKDATKNRNRPKSIIEIIYKDDKNDKNENAVFASGEEFMAARRKLLGEQECQQH